jgi:hypothetical protein
MASDKNFELFDPFLVYVAGVAASTQLFYCRSRNPEVKRSAQANLEKLKAFVDRQAIVWPWSQSIVSTDEYHLVYDRLTSDRRNEIWKG